MVCDCCLRELKYKAYRVYDSEGSSEICSLDCLKHYYGVVEVFEYYQTKNGITSSKRLYSKCLRNYYSDLEALIKDVNLEVIDIEIEKLDTQE